MFIRAAAVAALIVSTPASVAARVSEGVRQPTSKWLVEFADNECLLSRIYHLRP